MASDFLQSSDSVRTSRTLKHVQSVTLEKPVVLERGGTLPRVTIAYETYGTLNAARDNAVLICHALSGDSHVARHDPQDDVGWWDIMIGPGKPIDTDRYFVICPNILGGCRGTTGPSSIDPATGKPYGNRFPVVTIGDIVAAQKGLVDHLGIPKLLAVIGGSLGGYMVLDWATRFPDRLAGAIPVATSARLTSQGLAFDIIGRNAITRDPHYHDGQYDLAGVKPHVGLALARMLGHITYLSREAMMQKFDGNRRAPRAIDTPFETQFTVGSYLAYQGEKFVERFDANSYLTLTMAMDLFDLGDTALELRAAMAPSSCRWLVISFTSDWLFPPFQSQELVDTLIALNKPVSYCNVRSDCGHDAFLLENDLARYGEMIRAFLAQLHAPVAGRSKDRALLEDAAGPSSIFHRRRMDYDTIVELIGSKASVLDLGCGTGGLLCRLRENGHEHLMGIELDERAILECVRRGLNVIHADLNNGLPAFADGQFDAVVLSQTLPAVIDVQQVISDVLRVGKRGIISFPNIAHHESQQRLAQEGRAPRPSSFESLSWYNTPNVRFLSIADFEDFCQEQSIRIHQRIALDTRAGKIVEQDPNRNADVAVMVIGR